ncbi:diacylglycerol/lipid kinase family protein [Candidatus Uabimicrobium amorphum]|uniref:Diacylglycerol kinase n=1 Tax=Uabimicrobium amorphum TaxID=2596890 RepID=A0A5S9IUJ2_UABAM|nr:diacylglycerol kinase family protein [Candidatus Uabimicrobium amorphum]BBM87856.1 diacylglycerol kinase [Candidatus Uabimicrobium amorphum]
MKKIGVVYNPFAGKNKANPEKKQAVLEKIIGNRGIVRATQSIEDICNVAREFQEEGVDILGISGGDGTNQCVLTTFSEIYGEENLPLVALLRGGTMNLREQSLKMKGSPEARLKRLIKVLEKGDCPTIKHTLLKVNDRYGCIFGNGTVTNIMEEYYHGGNPGFKKACVLFLKSLFSSITNQKFITKLFSPIEAQVKIGDETLPQQSFTALMAATTKECGLGFKPFYRAQEKAGYIHFLAIDLSPTEVMKNLHRIRAGKKIHSERVYDIVTKKVEIQTVKPYYYTIDGEMLNTSSNITLAAGPTVNLLAI